MISLLDIPIVCQDPICPSGYKIILKQPQNSLYYTKSYVKEGIKSLHTKLSRRKGLRYIFILDIKSDSISI